MRGVVLGGFDHGLWGLGADANEWRQQLDHDPPAQDFQN
jgi:hypothetical protein